jgi:hypothetical protein
MVCDRIKLQEFMLRLDRPVGLFLFAARPLVRLHEQATLHELVKASTTVVSPQCHRLTQAGQERPGHDTAFDCQIDCSRFQRGQMFSQRTAR